MRWAAVTFRETEKHYRRITGFEHLWMLKAHVHDEDGALAEVQKAGVGCCCRHRLSTTGGTPPVLVQSGSSGIPVLPRGDETDSETLRAVMPAQGPERFVGSIGL